MARPPLRPPPVPRHWRRKLPVISGSLADQSVMAFLHPGDLTAGDGAAALRRPPRRPDRSGQAAPHLPSPGLGGAFDSGPGPAEDVRQAQRVIGVLQSETGSEAVVNRGSLRPGHHIAAAFAEPVTAKEFGAGDMKPGQRAVHPHPRPVEMPDRRPGRFGPQLTPKLPVTPGSAADHVVDRAVWDPHAEQMKERLAQPLRGHRPHRREMEDRGLDPRAVPSRGLRIFRILSRRRLAAAGAFTLENLMLRHFDRLDPRQVVNLP